MIKTKIQTQTILKVLKVLKVPKVLKSNQATAIKILAISKVHKVHKGLILIVFIFLDQIHTANPQMGEALQPEEASKVNEPVQHQLVNSFFQ